MERLTEQCGDVYIPRQDMRNNGYKKCMQRLAEYESTGLTPEEIFKLKQELESWKRESISDKAKLGEIRIWLEPVGVVLEEVLEEAKK